MRLKELKPGDKFILTNTILTPDEPAIVYEQVKHDAQEANLPHPLTPRTPLRTKDCTASGIRDENTEVIKLDL